MQHRNTESEITQEVTYLQLQPFVCGFILHSTFVNYKFTSFAFSKLNLTLYIVLNTIKTPQPLTIPLSWRSRRAGFAMQSKTKRHALGKEEFQEQGF